MQRFRIVLTFGYRGKPETSLSSLSQVDTSLEFLTANGDDVSFFTMVDAPSGMDAAVSTLIQAKRVEDRLLLSLLELEMQHDAEFEASDVNIN